MHCIVPLCNVLIVLIVVGGIVTLYPLAGGYAFVLLFVCAGLMSVTKADKS